MAEKHSPQIIRQSLLIALVFQLSWLAVAFLFGIFGAQVNWILLAVNLPTFWATAAFILVTGIKLSPSFQISFGIFITTSSLIGSALDGYGAIPNWDTIVHVYSGVVLAWFGLVIARKASASMGKALPLWFENSVILMMPLALAAVWEVYEYLSDTLFHTSMQAGGLEDTIVDMAAALIGATLFLGFDIYWHTRRKRS